MQILSLIESSKLINGLQLVLSISKFKFSNFKEIYEYLNSENISSKIDSKNILAEKLINNFNSAFPVNNNKAIKLNKYSEEIFDKVIKEYEKVII